MANPPHQTTKARRADYGLSFPSTEDEIINDIYVEEIPVIQNRHLTESEGSNPSASKIKKRKWGNPDPSAEVVALSPAQLQDFEKFPCDICDSSFPRMQNLRFHYTTHNVHHKLPQKNASGEPRKKKYALKSDLDAHQKKCGTKNYECNLCGSKYSRIDRFEIHKVKCRSEGPMPNEIMQISREKVSEVKDVPVPESSVSFGPSSPLSTNYIAQEFERCERFEIPEFNTLEQLQSRIQMSDSSQQHALDVDSYQEKSIWDLNYWDVI
ncbi:protein indeterminate-domain 7 [Daucus carota subsp. sativus]|uniref:protein indeterminate-domain 7 n=1 Tax=Daucus carota subsp. sativus TaxID=79200 RepID=UPI0007EF8297|nr:PREDICTED: protein indeterminate-domain 7-like [Daucus carota subsp. sativus]